jgi:hypothetical protein
MVIIPLISKLNLALFLFASFLSMTPSFLPGSTLLVLEVPGSNILADSSTGNTRQHKKSRMAEMGAHMKNIDCQPIEATIIGPNTTPIAIPPEYAEVTILCPIENFPFGN